MQRWDYIFHLWMYLVTTSLVYNVQSIELGPSPTDATITSLPVTFSCTFNTTDSRTGWQIAPPLSEECYNITTSSADPSQISTSLKLYKPLPSNQMYTFTCNGYQGNNTLYYSIDVEIEEVISTVPMQNTTKVDSSMIILPQRKTGAVVAVGVTEVCVIAVVAVLLSRKRQKMKEKKAKYTKETKTAKTVEMQEMKHASN